MDSSKSPWVQRAKEFIENTNNPKEEIYTVKFLIEGNYFGIDKRCKIDDIVKYLQENGYNISREEFQNNILTKLKKKGIVATLVYPGRGGGVFIPCNESEIKKVTNQVLKRVIQELDNLEGITCQTSLKSHIAFLKEVAKYVKSNIESM